MQGDLAQVVEFLVVKREGQRVGIDFNPGEAHWREIIHLVTGDQEAPCKLALTLKWPCCGAFLIRIRANRKRTSILLRVRHNCGLASSNSPAAERFRTQEREPAPHSAVP